jgi:tryptophan synthase alpha chain
MASVSATISSDRIAQRFAELRRAGRRAFVPYVTAGHPDVERSVALLQGLQEVGADVVELGVPFSDPMADGAVIQASSQKALENGVRLDGVLDIVSRAALNIPVVLFSYLNPLLRGGPEALQRAADAGVDGVLVVDLPLGADPVREAWFADGPLDYIRLVAPTTPPERIADITKTGSGFVYLISRLGVTGERTELPANLPETAARVRAATSLPLCIGFGISRPEQARAVARIADGVVVGSAIVRAADQSVEAALTLAASLRRGIDGN